MNLWKLTEVRVLTGTEKAKLDNGEFVLGTYEEIEKYAEEQVTCVDRYLGHINPSCVSSKFKYVGTSVNPYAVAKPIYIWKDGKYMGLRTFKSKF